MVEVSWQYFLHVSFYRKYDYESKLFY